MWQRHLTVDLLWPERAVHQYKFAWANSTRIQYNRYVDTFNTFCVDNGYSFPPVQSAVIADFLCKLADKSAAPRTVLRSTLAALDLVYKAKGIDSPLQSMEIRNLCTSLIKSGTSQPLNKSSVMPIKPFMNLFESWGPNELLSIKQLRLKAITLLTLGVMARPSDLAPKSVLFTNNTEHNIVLSTKHVSFNDDGSIDITLFGIKNDLDRKGFVVHLPPVTNKLLSVSDCLQVYIKRTSVHRLTLPDNPLFISLTQPYAAIKANTVGDQLKQAISLAGLDGCGYSAKSFRPTAATTAINLGCHPDTVRKIGRWHSMDVFYEHYVHTKPPDTYLDQLWSAQ